MSSCIPINGVCWNKQNHCIQCELYPAQNFWQPQINGHFLAVILRSHDPWIESKRLQIEAVYETVVAYSVNCTRPIVRYPPTELRKGFLTWLMNRFKVLVNSNWKLSKWGQWIYTNLYIPVAVVINLLVVASDVLDSLALLRRHGARFGFKMSASSNCRVRT